MCAQVVISGLADVRVRVKIRERVSDQTVTKLIPAMYAFIDLLEPQTRMQRLKRLILEIWHLERYVKPR